MTGQAQALTVDQLVFLHTDHLQTPRLATNDSQTVTWRWEGAAFGNTAPQADPDGDGIPTIFNPRFPGQYHDIESGLYYNWHRYYDPGTGRYVTSDPIGLVAGPNTYVYVRGNPVRYSDRLGLEDVSVDPSFGIEGPFRSPQVQVSFGVDGSVHAVIVGVGLGAGVTTDTDGTVCIFGSGSLTFGIGVFAGVGFSGGVSPGPNQTGLSRTVGISLVDGSAVVGGGEINIRKDGSVGASKGFGGVGEGGAAGFRETGIATFCFGQTTERECSQ